MTETKTSPKPGGTAAQFLQALHNEQADLWHEGLDALHEPERTALNKRCLAACEAGYLTVSPEGLFVMTAKGEAYVASAAAPKPAPKKVSGKGGLDVSALPAGKYAVPGGDSRLKLLVEHGTGKWDGWTFVKDAAVYGEAKRYGMQRPGQTYRGQVADALAVVLADPVAAMAEYGKLTGTCGACGRPLEDETSVARGIGPVCWSKLAA